MATHLPVPVEPTPGELISFDPMEWSSAGETSWEPAFKRWKAARRAWLAEHEHSDLGDMFDLFADEHEVKMQMVREDPPPPQPGISIRPAGR
jgi:hypothetical protein